MAMLMREEAVTTAARHVLIVDDDPTNLRRITEFLRSDPHPFEAVGVASAEAALRLLAADDRVDCLLADLALPGTGGLGLLAAAAELRPDLKIVVMTAAPTEELHRAALERGATRVLAKPLDLEHLLASVALEPPGALSHLEGDLSLMDVCWLSAACQTAGGVGIRYDGGEGTVAHRGTRVVHAAAAGQAGAPAFELLAARRRWRFESLSSLRSAHLAENCHLEMAADGREAARAAGNLRGLTLRHLIEWAMRSRQSCTLKVVSRQRAGALTFAAGKIRGAETAGRDGGRAAAEILGWENPRVELIRSPGLLAVPPSRPLSQGLEAMIDRFCEDVEGLIATSVLRAKDGVAVAARSADPRLDAAAAGAGYARVVESHLAAAGSLGDGAAWGETEDILITTARAYLLIRLLGEGHYHWLAVSSEANLALCRLVMRSHEPFLLSELAEPGAP